MYHYTLWYLVPKNGYFFPKNFAGQAGQSDTIPSWPRKERLEGKYEETSVKRHGHDKKE